MKASHKKQPILVVMLLDETGSMSAVRDETIASVNDYLADRRAEWMNDNQPYLITLAKFNSGKPNMVEVIHSATPVGEVKAIDRQSYVPSSFTPLYDAVGKVIADTENALAGMSFKPAVLFVIMTDGEENSSREYIAETIATIIEAKKAEGWKFVFMGVNIDAWVAGRMGVASTDTQSFQEFTTGLTTLSEATRIYAARLAEVSDTNLGFWKVETGE